MPRLRRLPRAPARARRACSLALALAVVRRLRRLHLHNTHVWNPYRTTLEDEQWPADYEKKFLRYETVPQPKITVVKLDIQIWPHETSGGHPRRLRDREPHRRADQRGARALRRATWIVNGVRDRGRAAAERRSRDFNYRIYTFDHADAAGRDAARSRFDHHAASSAASATAANIAADHGQRHVRERPRDRADARHGPQRPAAGPRQAAQVRPAAASCGSPKLGDARRRRSSTTCATTADWVHRRHHRHHRRRPDPDRARLRRSREVVDGRPAHGPLRHRRADPRTSSRSSRRATRCRRDPYKGVDVSVYYDPQHPWNVARIQHAMKAGLDYYQANFSPYQFRQVRILEFPDSAGPVRPVVRQHHPVVGGHLLHRRRPRPDQDRHGHLRRRARARPPVVGAPGDRRRRAGRRRCCRRPSPSTRPLHGDEADVRPGHDAQVPASSSSTATCARAAATVLEEQPLERVEDQPYIHYRKGSLVMYRLQDEIGEDAVNRALRQLLHDYAFKGPPYPTSLDLVKRPARRGAGRQAAADHRPVREDHALRREGVERGRRRSGRTASYDVDAHRRRQEALRRRPGPRDAGADERDARRRRLRRRARPRRATTRAR